MEASRYPGLQDNYKRAMVFLHLAVEQLRIYDSATADAIYQVHLSGLRDIFDRAVQLFAQEQLDPRHALQATALQQLGETSFRNAVADLPLSPPGLGSGILPEARKRVWNALEDAAIFRKAPATMKSTAPQPSMFRDNNVQAATGDLIDYWTPISGPTRVPSIASSRTVSGTYPLPNHGVIGQRKTSSSMDGSTASKRRTSTLPALNQGSEPLGRDALSSPENPSAIAPAAPQKPLPYDLGRFHIQDPAEPDHARANASDHSRSSSKTNNNLSAERMKSEEENTPSTMQVASESNKTISTWARVAAIPDSALTSSHFSGHMTSALTKAQRRLNPVRRPPLTTPIPTEALKNQLRAVWLGDLPAKYTLHDVSTQINEGPIMSILLDDDNMLPGHSACIIFQHAEHALAFLIANNHGIMPSATTNTTPKLPASKYPNAPSAYILPGAPFPADADITAMGSPTFARRRLKWSRARLFHDVPLATFKRDVYALVGLANVEFFHFYNAGECTVVFSSVRVAAVCLERFNAWKREPGTRDAEGNLSPDALMDLPGGGEGKGGRYEGVDVCFVRDFNEAPARLFSQYGVDGRVRKCANENGVEGLYGGPVVEGEVGERVN